MYKTIIAALALCGLIASQNLSSTVSAASVDQHPQQASAAREALNLASVRGAVGSSLMSAAGAF